MHQLEPGARPGPLIDRGQRDPSVDLDQAATAREKPGPLSRSLELPRALPPGVGPLVARWKRLFGRADGSLRARILIPTTLLFALTLGAMVFAATRLHASLDERAERESAELFANVVAEGVERAVQDRGISAIPDVLTAVTERRPEHRGDVIAVSVIGLDGRYSHSSVPELLGGLARALPSAPSMSPIVIFDPPTELVVLRPLEDLPCFGCRLDARLAGSWLEARFSREATARAQNDLTLALLLAAIPSWLLLLAIAWWLLGREAIAPLKRLVAAMRRAEAGEAIVEADEGRPDELGEAARRFDATLHALHRTHAEIETLHREQMERADRFAAVGEMATGLSHEIKNPLAGLSGALEIMAGDHDCTGARAEIVAEMRLQVARLSEIMEGLLGFVREHPRLMQPTDVNEVLERTVLLVTRRCKSACAKSLRPELAADLPLVRADPAKLQQVLLNLCLNACQAMEETSRPCCGGLKARTYVRGPRVVVEIADRGPGIPPDVRPHVFKPFYTTRKKGNGLGLAISEQIVLEHGGHISFSCPPEGGTIFTVALPVLRTGGASA